MSFAHTHLTKYLHIAFAAHTRSRGGLAWKRNKTPRGLRDMRRSRLSHQFAARIVSYSGTNTRPHHMEFCAHEYIINYRNANGGRVVNARTMELWLVRMEFSSSNWHILQHLYVTGAI